MTAGLARWGPHFPDAAGKPRWGPHFPDAAQAPAVTTVMAVGPAVVGVLMLDLIAGAQLTMEWGTDVEKHHDGTDSATTR